MKFAEIAKIAAIAGLSVWALNRFMGNITVAKKADGTLA